MAQVSNETELASALAGTDSSIQLTADISVTAVLKVQRDITLSSLSPDIYTLTKAASLSDNMFRIVIFFDTLRNKMMWGADVR